MEVLNAIKFWVKKDPELEHWKAQLVAAERKVKRLTNWVKEMERDINLFYDVAVGNQRETLEIQQRAKMLYHQGYEPEGLCWTVADEYSQLVRFLLRTLLQPQKDLAKAEITVKCIQAEIDRITDCHTDGWCTY